MKTIKIDIGELDPAARTYSARLLDVTEAGEALLATEAIPEALTLAGQTVSPEEFRSIVLETKGASGRFREIGEHLFRLLGAVGTAWDALRQGAEPVRALLEIRPERLALLPWELLSQGPDRWAMDPVNTIVRTHQYGAGPAEPAALGWPLRVLVVIGAGEGDAAVAAAEELQLIEEALRPVNRTVDLEILRQPAQSDLIRLWQDFKPHILHFIGHGGETAAGAPRLRFTLPAQLPGGQRNWNWTADDIFTELRDTQWTPRLVFINACRSETASIEIQKSAWSIGRTFRNLKVPATLTMQADVLGTAAGHLAGRFYSAIAEGLPIDAALARARTHVKTQLPNGIDLREWALPCLHVSIPPEKILPIKAAGPAPAISVFKDVIDKFVDRQIDRRKFVRGIDALAPLSGEKARCPNLIVVRGEEASGKTWISKWCMDACALQDHELRYVEVVSDRGKDWLDVLLQIRDGDPRRAALSFVFAPLPEAAFHQFNWELHHRLQGKEPPERNGATVAPPGRDLPGARPMSELNEHFARHTFASFRGALEQAANGRLLILSLDHFTAGDATLPAPEMRNYLRPEWIDRIAGAKESPVKLVLTLNDKEYDDYGIEELRGLFQDVPLGGLPPEQFVDLAKEFFRYSGFGNQESLANLIVAYKDFFIDAAWKPSEFQEFSDWISRKRKRG
ncbi:MAG: CHAT domain-containing protein [Blastocatellia bacterium]|nr:CHAT domain-containing protein [Blastocatellia bacterium]